MDALITDAHIPSSVTGLRALGRSGLRVVALGPSRAAAGLWSRHAAARALGPDAIEDPRGYVRAVAGEAERHGRLVVYPGQDESLNALLDARADLPADALLPYAGHESLAALRDKARLSELAAASGLPTPTLLASGRADALLEGELPDGAVVKPVRPGGDFPEAVAAPSRKSLREILAGAPPAANVMLQEHVTGRLMAVSVVVDRDGGLVRRFQQVAVRTWPEAAGISSLAVSVEPNEDLVEAARSLLAAAGHWGLAQLQFIEGPDGPRLIDVNTRFYGSLALALAAGVDLPGAWHAVALGQPAGRPEPYRTGVFYRWLEADLMAAAHGRPRHLFSRPRRPRTGPMWARDDPAASALFAAGAVAAPIARRLRRG